VTSAVASHHLRKLRDLKILKYRNDGKLAYYSLKDPRIFEILNALKQIASSVFCFMQMFKYWFECLGVLWFNILTLV